MSSRFFDFSIKNYIFIDIAKRKEVILWTFMNLADKL